MSPWTADAALAVALCVGGVLWELYEPHQGMEPPDAVSRLLIVVVNLPLAARRRLPFTVLAVSCAAAMLYHHLGYGYGQNNMGPLLALYTVAAHRPLGWAVTGGLLTAAEWAHANLAMVRANSAMAQAKPWSVLAQSMLVCACVLVIGRGVLLLAERNNSLADLSERLRRERERAEHQAAVAERVRIARELHDVVAHHMSVIAVQSGLARYVLRTDPATAENALELIAESSSEGLAEARRMTSVLRVDAEDAGSEEDDVFGPGPTGPARIQVMVDRMRSAGLPVELVVMGESRPLLPAMDRSVYRLLQEALTNVIKHAGLVRTRVELAYGTAELSIRVVNDAPAEAVQPLPDAKSGHGLIGMRERVLLFEGTFRAGRSPQGGFEVTAVFPLPVPVGEER
ncbi:histidine kinase [Actinomadura fulvescens]|uniref:histidine kinase n=1 Tax=Actinomadura fulvescens TaxID=46160 RepID=A0ABP6CEW1_9ACTN